MNLLLVAFASLFCHLVSGAPTALEPCCEGVNNIMQIIVDSLNCFPSQVQPTIGTGNCTNSNVNCMIPSDYKKVDDLGAYKFHSKKRKWNKARKICEKEGGYLAISNSGKERRFLEELSREEFIWLGIRGRVVEGQFKTVTGQDLRKQYSRYWSGAQPSYNHESKAEKDCVILLRNIQWDNQPCDSKFAFICEFNINPQC